MCLMIILIMLVSSVYNFDFSGQMEPPFSDIQYFTFNIPNNHVRVLRHAQHQLRPAQQNCVPPAGGSWRFHKKSFFLQSKKKL